jgi:SET domain-containing protein
MELFKHKDIVANDTSISGFGVFAISDIKSGELIEECHHIPLSQKFYEIDKFLQTYVFSWPKGNGRMATVALGYGGMYNHSRDANVDWVTDEKRNLFIFKAIRDIKCGDELFINYGEAYEAIIKTVS